MQNNVWTIPLLVGLASLTGLTAALVADGWADTISTLLLAVPVYLSLRHGLR